MRARSILVTGLLAPALAVPMSLAGPAANADPQHGELIALTCGSATYHVVVNGNGEFTPAHDVNSTKVFIPTEFEGFTGVIRDTHGTIVDQFTDPTVSQKGDGHVHGTLHCTFLFTFVGDGTDPELPAGYTFTGSGGVTGKVV